MTYRTRIATLIIALVAMTFAGVATHNLAAGANGLGISVPGNQSAGDQYVETLPTTKGPRAPGRKGHARQLSRDAAKQLQRLGGPDAATLKALATSPALGAPTNGGGAHSRSGSNKTSHLGASTTKGRGHGENGRRQGAPAVPSAAIDTADGGEAGIGWLVFALLAITAVSLGGVVYQRRRHKGPVE
jgi:hypothetical protein